MCLVVVCGSQLLSNPVVYIICNYKMYIMNGKRDKVETNIVMKITVCAEDNAIFAFSAASRNLWRAMISLVTSIPCYKCDNSSRWLGHY